MKNNFDTSLTNLNLEYLWCSWGYAKGMGEKLILIEVKSAVQITRKKQTQGLR